jgi:hypothetical protein
MEELIMNEIIFIVEAADEGGYIARALGAAIFTEADDLQTLHENVREAVKCHFDAGPRDSSPNGGGRYVENTIVVAVAK